jgi:hypothetical protein
MVGPTITFFEQQIHIHGGGDRLHTVGVPWM